VAERGYDTVLYKQPKTRADRLWEKEQFYLAQWLSGLPKPVGIMTCNDDRGQHVTEACAIAGLKVPYEVAIVGVDNDDQICDVCYPPLSSVALNVERGGFKAAQLLDQRMRGGDVSEWTVVVRPSRVVTRRSSESMAIEDGTVADALHYIRRNARNPIQVEDVVEALHASRRTLHDKFKRALGCTVHDEIKRVRVELIIQMLIDTDVSISEIAYNLGYESADHIARYFRAKVGVSPAEYRKLHGRG
jgi:LacI family transcriptional regulator